MASEMTKTFIAISILTASAIAGASPPASAGGIRELLFGSLDSTQSECQAQNPGSFLNTWKCIRARVAQGHTGDMRNGSAMKYMATGNMLFANVQARKFDDATALYYLATALSQGDLEYRATHPESPTVTYNSYGYTTTCY